MQFLPLPNTQYCFYGRLVVNFSIKSWQPVKFTIEIRPEISTSLALLMMYRKILPKEYDWFDFPTKWIFTARQRSCWKVMFLHLFVCPGGMMSIPVWSHVLSGGMMSLPVWSHVLSEGSTSRVGGLPPEGKEVKGVYLQRGRGVSGSSLLA